MWKLSDLIGDYEEPSTLKLDGIRKEVPIATPSNFGWKQLESPTRLTRIFKFEEEEKFNSFLLDVLEHQSETSHHGRLTVQFPQVKIDIWTQTLNDVTEIDLEWSRSVTEIYEGYNE